MISLNTFQHETASICVTLFELFIICISRQYEKSDERIEIWKLFAKNNRFGIIDAVLKAAIPHFGNRWVLFYFPISGFVSGQEIRKNGKVSVHLIYAIINIILII